MIPVGVDLNGTTMLKERQTQPKQLGGETED
jgi:hypothetical protein